MRVVKAAAVTDRRVEKGVGSLFLTEVAKSKFESIDSMLEQLGKRRSENQEGHYGTN